MTIDQCRGSWLKAKYERTRSNRTKQAYADYLDQFRAFLLATKHMDLDGPASIIAPVAQIWCSSNSKAPGTPVASTTFRVRLSILASFYAYAEKNEVVAVNPVKRVEPPRRIIEHAAPTMHAQKLKTDLKAIDRGTVAGQRDYALLSVALETLRRVSELAGLCMKDIEIINEKEIILTWRRTKGGDVLTDTLKAAATHVLLTYLEQYYVKILGYASLQDVPGDKPVWVSLSPNNRGGALSTRTLQRLSEEYFGSSKFHLTRRSAAVALLRAGVPIEHISKQLGHKSIATTAIYLKDAVANANEYGHVLEDAFGIE